MWVVSGPFDGEIAGEISFSKLKLLKTGSKYLLSRKDDCGLAINHKKVSKSNGEFTIGNYSQEDALDPTRVPKLELCNTKDKVMLISRGSDTLSINPSATQELEDGDIITIAGGIGITVNWIRVSCFSPIVRGQAAVSMERCASLGISVTPTSSPENTHHLVSNYAVNASIAASLMSATQLVKPEWLEELIRLGSLSVKNGSITCTSLEKTFLLPLVAKFRPTFPASLPHTLKTVNVWEPNEERLSLFRGYRFLFMVDKSLDIESSMKEVVVRGQGEYDCFQISGGRVKWRHALTKCKKKLSEHEDGKEMVLVGDAKIIAEKTGSEPWTQLTEESSSFGLHCISAEKILHAVLYVDVSHIDCSGAAAQDQETSPLPSLIPNTYSDEPSAPNEGERSSRPRAASGSAGTSAQSSDLLNITVPPPPRKPLVRRTKGARSAIIGIDDISAALDASPEEEQKEMPPTPAEPTKVKSFDLTAHIPARSSRLKRREVNAAPASGSQLLSPLEGDHVEPESEPPLKKFKALYEASDPDKLSQEGFSLGTDYTASEQRVQDYSSNAGYSQLKSVPSGIGGTLEAILEEHEERNGSNEDVNPLKRKADSAGPIATEGTDRPKRPALADRDAIPLRENDASGISKGEAVRSPKKPGAAPGQPDTDVAFLKALASTKRGKKSEDAFDREFNQLRISKPNLQESGREEDWTVLAEFGEDQNVRGNFMVVMELDIRTRGHTLELGNVTRAEWQGRQNFKKFKRRAAPDSKKRIELVATQESDYGVGAAYWKRNKSYSQVHSQVQSQSQDHAKAVTERRTHKSINSQSQPTHVEVPEKRPPRKGSTTSVPKAPSLTKPAPVEEPVPLFLDDDEHDGVTPSQPPIAILENKDEEEVTEVAPPKPAPRKSSRKTTKAVVVQADSDDEGATFKGFLRRTTRSRR